MHYLRLFAEGVGWISIILTVIIFVGIKLIPDE